MIDLLRRPLSALLAVLALGAGALPAGAQPFPSKPIRLVIGYPPGGAVDANARLIAPKLSELMGQPVMVENRPGASGVIATDYVAKSPPDGYTILLTTIGHCITPVITKKPPYEPVTDFVPVSQVTGTSMVLLVNPNVPAKTLPEFVALAKSKPGKLNYGSSGPGDPLGLAMEVLKQTADINLMEIPYKGVGPTYTALLAGEIDAAFMPPSASLPYIKAGTLRAIAVGGGRRSSALPDVPTVAESGYPGFDAVNWQGLFLPAGTPQDIAQRYQREVAKVLAMPEIRDRLVQGGQDVVASTPEEFIVRIKSDVAKFAKVVRDAKIPLQD